MAVLVERDGVGWLTKAQVQTSLERLCGRWNDTTGSSYSLDRDVTDESLSVTTTRACGKIICTMSLIRVERWQNIGCIVFGKPGRKIYRLILFEDEQLQWSKIGSKTFTWYRTGCHWRHSAAEATSLQAPPSSESSSLGLYLGPFNFMRM